VGEFEVDSPPEVHQKDVTGEKMKKFLLYLLLAVFALSAATPAFAYHHRRHHRYHDGRPIVVFHIPG
jgi:hypothetical protein